MNVDGSITPVNFDFTANQYCEVRRINFFIQDNGIQPSNFGGLSELTNGIELKIPGKLDFLAGFPIKTHRQFGLLAGINIDLASGPGDDVITVNWEREEDIHLEAGDKIRLTVKDNLSGLSKFYAMVQGNYLGQAHEL